MYTHVRYDLFAYYLNTILIEKKISENLSPIYFNNTVYNTSY